MNSPLLPWILAIAGWMLVLLLTGMLISNRNALRIRWTNSSDPDQSDLFRGIARQLDALEKMGGKIDGLDRAFRIPRLRGGFGETLLEELLRAWLPEGSWSTQYGFPDGVRADAVVRMGSRLVVVDSKFPMERLEDWLEDENAGMTGDVRRGFISHAESIAAKYIRPQDGTLNFALMYLPAENIHYRLLRDDDGSVLRECLRRRILPVGPMSLFAYLQTVSYGLKGLALPAEGKELRRRVDRIRADFEALTRPLATASTHLKNLNGSWQEIDRRLGRLEDGIEALDRSSPSSGATALGTPTAREAIRNRRTGK